MTVFYELDLPGTRRHCRRDLRTDSVAEAQARMQTLRASGKFAWIENNDGALDQRFFKEHKD